MVHQVHIWGGRTGIVLHVRSCEPPAARRRLAVDIVGSFWCRPAGRGRRRAPLLQLGQARHFVAFYICVVNGRYLLRGGDRRYIRSMPWRSAIADLRQDVVARRNRRGGTGGGILFLRDARTCVWWYMVDVTMVRAHRATLPDGDSEGPPRLLVDHKARARRAENGRDGPRCENGVVGRFSCQRAPCLLARCARMVFFICMNVVRSSPFSTRLRRCQRKTKKTWRGTPPGAYHTCRSGRVDVNARRVHERAMKIWWLDNSMYAPARASAGA